MRMRGLVKQAPFLVLSFMGYNNFFITIFGPTAVGKTDFALKLAEHIPAEIINMDVGQFYTPLSIGTAKPDWRSYTTPHHFFDILNEPTDLTVVEYRKRILDLFKKIWAKGKVPIIVGGSGFYLKSLFFPPYSDELKNTNDTYSDSDNLWDLLYSIDPLRAQQIAKDDEYRIKRALDIWFATGKKPSDYVPQFKPLGQALFINLTRDRVQLYDRINKRVTIMLEEGWLDEVKRLHGTQWDNFLRRKKIIGYDELLEYLSGEQTKTVLNSTIEAIQKRTRNYAKRQLTFARMLERDLKKYGYPDINTLSLDLTLDDLDLYIKQLLNQELKQFHS